MKAPLLQLIDEERGSEVPDADLNPTGRIRRALFRGETLNRRDTEQRFSASTGLLSQVIGIMERLGYVIERGDGEHGMTYRLVNPEHTPTDEQLLTQRRHSYTPRARNTAAVVEAAKPRTPRTNGHGHDIELPFRLPGLGAQVGVYALALNDDGSVTMGLRRGDERWITTVTGAVEE